MLNKKLNIMIVTFKHFPTGQINGLSAVKGSSIDKLKNYFRLHFRKYEMYSVNGVFRVIIHSKNYDKYCSLVLWYEANCEYIQSVALADVNITSDCILNLNEKHEGAQSLPVRI